MSGKTEERCVTPYNRAMVDAQLGEFGEQEALAQLQRSLLGAGARFTGFSDKGVDMVVQFEAPVPEPELLHFAVQVKTGDSYATPDRSRWRIRNLDGERFRQWTRSVIPVVFVWVRPRTPAECYWALVKRDSSREHFTISRRAIVAPTLRYDLWLERCRDAHDVTIVGDLLRPPLSRSMRDVAKKYFQNHLLGRSTVNPVLGEIAFTWSGWRHMTRRGRKAKYIHRSLELLTNAFTAAAVVPRFVAKRRVSHVTRGKWVHDIRLIAMRGIRLTFAERSPADITIVVREHIMYPSAWPTDVTLHSQIRRRLIFHSIYEKAAP